MYNKVCKSFESTTIECQFPHVFERKKNILRTFFFAVTQNLVDAVYISLLIVSLGHI